MLNKLQLLTLSLAGTILVSAVSLAPANAETANETATSTTNNGFLQQINEQYSKVTQYIQSLSSDFSQGLGELSGEVQSQINKTIGDLGIPDMVRAGKNIEDVLAGKPTDILHLDARTQGKNARQNWNQQYTTAQSEGILGVEGQKAMHRESEVAQAAADTASQNADAAQGDIVTQEVLKKIALQNAQITQVLKLVQGSLSEQTKIGAAANVNLSNISENLSIEQRRKQNESQGVVNAIYRNAAFADGFWSSNK